MKAYSWDDAANLWLREKKHKATIDRDEQKLRWLEPYLGGKRLKDIDRDTIMVAAWDKARATSQATANRHLALIRAIFRRACKVWEWIDRIPFVELFPEKSIRVRWITPGQARRLLDVLPVHQREMVLFALATGLRQGNVLKLEWSQVDMRRKLAWIHADQRRPDGRSRCRSTIWPWPCCEAAEAGTRTVCSPTKGNPLPGQTHLHGAGL